jgi:ribosome maturation protein SDO1
VIPLVSLEKSVIARLDTHGERFEVLVDPDLAVEFKRKEEPDISMVLAVETVFKDARKGARASEERMRAIFSTTDSLEVAKKIIRKGEIQFTTDQRRKLMEAKKRKLAAIIARNAINPQTNAPHPPHRIEQALGEVRFHVDLVKPVEEQVPKAVKAIRPLLPIRFEMRRVALKIPGQYAGKAHSLIKSFGDVKKEEWQKDGSWILLMEIPAGMVEELFRGLNSLTKGEVETRMLRKDL